MEGTMANMADPVLYYVFGQLIDDTWELLEGPVFSPHNDPSYVRNRVNALTSSGNIKYKKYVGVESLVGTIEGQVP
jgi:hypothetical protein